VQLIARTPLPPGNFISLEGQFQAQEQATRLIAGLSLVSLAMMFLVLYSATSRRCWRPSSWPTSRWR
jgi:Cu/Ag efflux pump CusA